MNELLLHEELMLLALRDKEGTIASGAWYGQAVAGALLADLMLRGRIEVGGDEKADVQVLDPSAVGEDLLDACLQKIGSDEKPRSLTHWLSKISGLTNLRHRAVAGLVARGTLSADRDKILWIFNRRIYPEIDPIPEKELIDRLRQTIFDGTTEIDSHMTVLLAIAHHTGLLRLTFPAKDLKPQEKRIEEIISGEPTGNAVSSVIKGVSAALFVATIIPATTAVIVS